MEHDTTIDDDQVFYSAERVSIYQNSQTVDRQHALGRSMCMCSAQRCQLSKNRRRGCIHNTRLGHSDQPAMLLCAAFMDVATTIGFISSCW